MRRSDADSKRQSPAKRIGRVQGPRHLTYGPLVNGCRVPPPDRRAGVGGNAAAGTSSEVPVKAVEAPGEGVRAAAEGAVAHGARARDALRLDSATSPPRESHRTGERTRMSEQSLWTEV